MKDTLLTLLLSNNQITTIATSTFGSHGDATEAWGLTELRTLKLAHNKLQYIQNGFFKTGTEWNSLVEIDLSNNGIYRLYPDTFQGANLLTLVRA